MSNEYFREYYKKNSEVLKEYNRLYYKLWRIKNKESEKLRISLYKIQNKIKVNAQNMAKRNIQMPKGQICQSCNIREAKDKHHKDYSKPLDIIFVCRECHYKLNRGIK